MAFVAESEQETQFGMMKTGSGAIGPGEYHNEGYLHKVAMDTIYPKKAVPFNANTSRGLVQFQQSKVHATSSPGKL